LHGCGAGGGGRGDFYFVAEGRESIGDFPDLIRAAVSLVAGDGIANENAAHVTILLLDQSSVQRKADS
jgi:hypothetical protein